MPEDRRPDAEVEFNDEIERLGRENERLRRARDAADEVVRRCQQVRDDWAQTDPLAPNYDLWSELCDALAANQEGSDDGAAT